MERFLPESPVGAAALPDEVLGVLPGGHAVGGAAAFHDGEARLLHGSAHLLLGGEEERPDEGQAPVGQLRHRRKAADAALPPEIHVKGLDGVVEVMAQRHLVAAQLFGGGMESAPAQIGAERAGIFLLSVVEDDGADEGAAHLVGHTVLPEKGFQRGVVHRLAPELGVEGDGCHLKGKAEVLPQLRKAHRQGYAVLAARNAHEDAVAGGKHLILLDGFAHQAAEPLHRFRAAHDRLTLSTRFTMSLMEASLVSAET